MKNIALVGFMGTGKTTIAAKLSHLLDMKYVSVDDLIEKSQKKTINEIFTTEGEDYFRDCESRIIKELSMERNLVIDTGGGAMIRQENVDNLKSGGTIVCLTASEDAILARTKRYKHRPLLNVEDPRRKVKELMAIRAPYYAKAEYFIDTDNLTVKQAVEKIAAIVAAGKRPETGV